MSERLFTYGTLSPGQANEHLLKPVVGHWESASVRGTFHFDGWGSAMGYPGIVLKQEGDVIEGYLFTSDALPAQWDMLDEFEGNGYQRQLTAVKRSDGSVVEAYIYALIKK